MITPMSHYHSAPPSPRVAMTHADAKPAPYIARLQQHVALGLSPAQAMAEIERADGHRRGLPVNKLYTSTADMILPHLTREWQALTPEFCARVGAAHDTIRMSMKNMITAGLVEQRKGTTNKPSQWRLA